MKIETIKYKVFILLDYLIFGKGIKIDEIREIKLEKLKLTKTIVNEIKNA